MNNDTLLKVVVIIVVAFNIAQALIMTTTIQSITKPAVLVYDNTAELGLCVNHAPIIDLTACNTTAIQGIPYYCKVNVSDLDLQNHTFSSRFIDEEDLFNITNDGIINWTPNPSHVGNHTVLITVSDNSGCGNSQDSQYFNFEVINVNDPPILLQPLPTPQQMVNEQVLVAFYLDNYFWDPDIPYGDSLSYLYSITNNASINISIEADSRVVIRSNTCPITAYVVFTAVDSYGATNNSNTVTVEVSCQQQPSPGTGTSTGSGSGISGSVFSCTPKWECGVWQPCLPNGTQYRRCVDKHVCDINNYIKYFWRNCTYWYQCANGIKDPNEEGIDCGGPCPPCASCNDSIQNCHDNDCEQGVDCGGPCPPCPSCFDKIKNCHDGACEEGVDCGGPCPPCKQIEAPIVVPKPYRLATMIIALLLLVIAIIITLYQYYKPFKKQKVIHKEVLIKKSDALELAKHIAKYELALENLVHRNKNPYMLMDYVLRVYNNYLGIVLNITPRASPQEMLKAIKNLKATRGLKLLLSQIIEQITVLHKQPIIKDFKLSSLMIKALIEEFKALLTITSTLTARDITMYELLKHTTKEYSYHLKLETKQQGIASTIAKAFKALQHMNIRAVYYIKNIYSLYSYKELREELKKEELKKELLGYFIMIKPLQQFINYASKLYGWNTVRLEYK